MFIPGIILHPSRVLKNTLREVLKRQKYLPYTRSLFGGYGKNDSGLYQVEYHNGDKK